MNLTLKNMNDFKVNNMKKVSIIVPIYNVERYLEKCLISAMNQTLQDIEIICINDGSTDRSPQILKRIAKKDARIKVINKANTGYGHTMNIGLDLAQGKYIVFLESDDYILPNMCQILYEKCEEHNLEIVKTDFFEFKTRGEKVYSRYRRVSDYKNYQQVLSPKSSPNLFFATMNTWTCMYKKEFIDKYRIRHNETPEASFQDNGFWFQTLMNCKRMYLLDQAFYMYRQDNPDSSIYSRGKVTAFSEEYTFIRAKINEYEGDKEIFFNICAFFNIHHNLISLKRVDKMYTEELIHLILKDFDMYRRKRFWNVKSLPIEFIKKILVCWVQPEELKERIGVYLDRDANRRHVLERYDSIILYGAGVYANRVLDMFEECKIWNKDIYCGISAVPEPGQEINGIEIKGMHELLKYKDSALVIVCARKDSECCAQMYQNLEEWGAEHIVHANDVLVKDFWDEIL